MPSPQKLEFRCRVVGEDPIQAQAPLFSNFVAISHVGREVQIEFLFLDLNRVADQMQHQKSEPQHSEPPMFAGKTVAKVVVPAWAFLQLKDHLSGVFQKLEVELNEGQKKASSSGEATYGA
jgi:hypothetical protein